MSKPMAGNFVIRWWRQWRVARRAAAQLAPVPPAQLARAPKALRGSSLEPLEGRIAPATLTPTMVTYQDLDGDTVTVKFSKALYNATTATPSQIANIKSVFGFTSDGVSFSAFGDANSGAQQLQLIDLTKVPSSLLNVRLIDGVSIAVSVKQGIAGDGLAEIGQIYADGLVLGAVAIAGDLGNIIVGNSTTATGLKSLSVHSLGFSSTSQSALNSTSYESIITGALGRLTVDTQLYGYVHVVDGFLANAPALGKIGSVSIGGSIDGTVAGKLGSIFTDRGIGSIKVGYDVSLMSRGIFGGTVDNAGSIRASGSVGSLTIDGVLLGGAMTSTGLVSVDGDLGVVKISGSILGGAGTNSGALIVADHLGSMRILGSITGAAGVNSGSVQAGGIGAFTLGDSAVDSLTGGTGKHSGSITSALGVGSVSILGDVLGSGERSGSITIGGNAGALKINGAFTGGTGDFSGIVEVTGRTTAITIGGSVLGAAGIASGSISVGENLGALTVGGHLGGGVGNNSGSIFSGVNFSSGAGLGTAKIAHGLAGGAGNNSGSLIVSGKLGTLKLNALGAGSALLGGTGAYSGTLFCGSTIGQLNVTGDVEGGDGARSGAIQAQGQLVRAAITGALKGGAGTYSGSIFNQTDPLVDQAVSGRLGNIQVRQGLQGGAGTHSGSIEAEGGLGMVTVDSIAGGTGVGSGIVRSGTSVAESGSTTALVVIHGITGGWGSGSGLVEIDGSLGSLKVGGNVTQSVVRVADSIASVSIAGDLAQSTLSARGQSVQGLLTDVAFGSLKILGSVSNSFILAGYDLSGAAVNADAQIGAVSVGVNWSGSSLVAGVQAGSGTNFGQMSDAVIAGTNSAMIISRIASVKIGGAVTGTANPGRDHFGFVAQEIGAFQSGSNAALALSKTLGGQVFELGGGTSDVSLREI